jgi:hypothetical protein
MSVLSRAYLDVSHSGRVVGVIRAKEISGYVDGFVIEEEVTDTLKHQN